MRVTYRPLSNYPARETILRRSSQFRTHFNQTLGKLAREIEHLGCDEFVIEMDLAETDLRNDGLPRSGAKARSPRVVISLPKSKHGPLRYPCDTFSAWEENVHAIAKALEALRAVDRYGVTSRGQQYAGWKALGSGEPEDAMLLDEAAKVVAQYSGVTPNVITSSPTIARAACLDAVKATHPDAGNQSEGFRKVQRARKTLSAHHGVSL